MQTVTIVFFSNDKFAMLLGVALCSLFENKKGNYPINVYVIDSGISAKNKKRLRTLEKRYGFSINYVFFDKPFSEEIPFADLSSRYYQPIESYYRLAVDRFLPSSCRRVIDMDVDVVFTGDIAKLFNLDLEGKTIGAVAECYPSCKAKQEYLKKLCKSFHLLPMPKEVVYFNAGILLIDLGLWRKRDVEKKVFKLIREHPEKLLLHDQDALNIVLLGDCKELAAKYNLIVSQDNSLHCRNPFAIHFSGGAKPWYFFSALRHRSEYLKYIKKTPWKHRKYRKIMDIYFAKKYHMYPVAWGVWSIYKKLRAFTKKILGR